MSTTQISKKRVKIFHPFFVAIFPVLIIYSQNIGRVEFEDLFLPLILFISFSVGFRSVLLVLHPIRMYINNIEIYNNNFLYIIE